MATKKTSKQTEEYTDTGDIGAWGTAEQRMAWGVGDEEHPYTARDYTRLDDIFTAYTARLVSGGGYDEQQEDTLRLCSVLKLKMEKSLAKNDIDTAQKLQRMIQINLESESLRKKDEKPLEDLRIDSIVDALEKAGLLQDGKILPLPDLQKALLERLGALGGKPSHKFPYTLDAADQMIQIVINTMRANDGLPEYTDFTDNMTFDENVGCEFADEPNQDELAAYEGMELVRHRKKN